MMNLLELLVETQYSYYWKTTCDRCDYIPSGTLEQARMINHMSWSRLKQHE